MSNYWPPDNSPERQKFIDEVEDVSGLRGPYQIEGEWFIYYTTKNEDATYSYLKICLGDVTKEDAEYTQESLKDNYYATKVLSKIAQQYGENIGKLRMRR